MRQLGRYSRILYCNILEKLVRAMQTTEKYEPKKLEKQPKKVFAPAHEYHFTRCSEPDADWYRPKEECRTLLFAS